MLLFKQYPFLLLLFFVAVILTLLTIRCKKVSCITALLAGLVVTGMLIYGLYCSIPLKSLLVLVLLLLLCGLFTRREDTL